jgi:hypothetical protein
LSSRIASRIPLECDTALQRYRRRPPNRTGHLVTAPPSDKAAGEFRLEANRSEMAGIGRRLKRTPQFAFEVGKRCGWRCAVCAIQVQPLLDAAHIRGVADKGSDDCRNGLILCKNHHSAFDAGLMSFEPETGAVVLDESITAEQLGVSVLTLSEGIRPHADALRWRWKQSGGNRRRLSQSAKRPILGVANQEPSAGREPAART